MGILRLLRLSRLSAACCIVWIGCAGSHGPDATGAPAASRISGLPSVPFALAQSSASFQRLFDGVDEALLDRMPEPDVETEPAYRRWVEGELVPWLERRGSALIAAEHRLAALDSAPDGERAVGRALIAFLAERTREDVLEAPVPNESSRPDRAASLREAWRERLEPLRQSSRNHWTECAEVLSLASPELAPWKQRCDDELADSAP